MTFILRGKELLLDRQGEEAKYPEAVPRIFQTAPVEDYNRSICVSLCQNLQSNFSWISHRDYEYDTCGLNQYYDDRVTHPESTTKLYSSTHQSDTNNHKICSIDDCPDKTTFASLDYSVEYLRWDEANLNETQLRKNLTDIFIKSDSEFFTIKNINIKKKFEEYLAEIGGNFGLFAGASILTFVEFGLLVVKILKGKFLNRQRLKKCVTYQVEEGKI